MSYLMYWTGPFFVFLPFWDIGFSCIGFTVTGMFKDFRFLIGFLIIQILLNIFEHAQCVRTLWTVWCFQWHSNIFEWMICLHIFKSVCPVWLLNIIQHFWVVFECYSQSFEFVELFGYESNILEYVAILNIIQRCSNLLNTAQTKECVRVWIHSIFLNS